MDDFHIHYEEDIFIGEVADLCHIDRRRIASLFEKGTNMTPVQYLMHYRISKAKELLKTSGLPIMQITEAVDYRDSFYFSRI